MPAQPPSPQRPLVGVAAVITKPNSSILMGIRKSSHGQGKQTSQPPLPLSQPSSHPGSSCPGTLALPGGHLELNETFQQCAEREAAEETGLAVRADRCFATTNDIFQEGKHYVTVWVRCGVVELEAEAKVSWGLECGVLE